MARPPGTRIRVAVLNPARRTVVVYGNAIGEHDGMVAVNCDDGRALYVHPVNVRYLEPATAPTSSPARQVPLNSSSSAGGRS